MIKRCQYCENKQVAKNLCQRHYVMQRRHGRIFKTAFDINPIFTGDHQYLDVKGHKILFDKDLDLKSLLKSIAITSHGYATTNGKYIHRIITGAKEGQLVDHINGNKLDNRKKNLRLCNTSENLRNRGLQSNNTSGFTGVYWSAKQRKWIAQITLNRHTKVIGNFKEMADAVRARNIAVKKYYGEYGRVAAI